MYQVQPGGGLNMFWVYCDMTSFLGGWTMCYSTDNLVRPQTEVTYDENLPYGTNGYRTDCNNIEVNSVSFETPIVYQFPMKLPTHLLSVIIPAKYVISKSKLS